MATALARSTTNRDARRRAATVAREIELLAARRERVRERQDRLRVRLREFDAELGELDARQRDLDRLLTGDSDSDPLPAPASALLGGAALRRRAVAHLLATGQHQEIHYRDWYQQLVADGLLIRGADPTATFLANITRSPLIARGERPGTYRVDPQAPGRIHALLVEARRRLRAAAAAHRDPGRRRAARLRALVDRLQRLEDEIADCQRVAAERRQR